MKTFKNPDLNAPRYRPKRPNLLNKEFCTEFRERYPEYSSLSDKAIKDKVKFINQIIADAITTERDGVELPQKLGYIFIGSCPAKKSSNIDYASSRKLGVNVQFQNWNTDNNVSKIFYTNTESRYHFKFCHLWAFKGSRELRKAVSEAFKENWMNYVRVDNYKLISRLFRKESRILDEKLNPNL